MIRTLMLIYWGYTNTIVYEGGHGRKTETEIMQLRR